MLFVLGVASLDTDLSQFPIAVWLQSPKNAIRYKQAGVNLYIGLWQGPTEEDLSALKAAGMPVVCDQNAVGLKHRDDPTIVGWLQQDEPDNAQPNGNGYGPCVPPEKIVEIYRRLKANDPSRPVILNLGQGVANDGWVGRGSGAKLDDYKTYVNGGDIVTFDIYPVSSMNADSIPLVAKGVDRLRGWCGPGKRSWNCLECTGIDSGKKATPEQVKSELWMSVIHGSTGIVYFCHEFKPAFKEDALLQDPEMLAAVTKDNAELQSLARVILQSPPASEVNVKSSSPVDFMARKSDGATYIFSVGMRNASTTAEFSVGGSGSVEVLGEGRTIPLVDGGFSDSFSPYGVHLYRITGR